MPVADLQQEHDRVGHALSGALLVLADPDGIIATVPGVEKRSGHVSVDAGAPDPA